MRRPASGARSAAARLAAGLLVACSATALLALPSASVSPDRASADSDRLVADAGTAAASDTTVAWGVPVVGKTTGPPHFRVVPSSQMPPGSLRELLTPKEIAFVDALPVVRVGVPDPPYRPYEQLGADGEVSGIHPEMLASVAQGLGLRIVPVVFNGWPATLEAARKGEVDLLMTVGVSPERLQFLQYTLGTSPSQAALFARSGTIRADETTARYAEQRGYIAASWVRQLHPKATIVEVDSTTSALEAVADGRADYYLGGLLEAVDTMQRETVRGVEALRLMSYATGQFHFAVRKDWAPLAAILSKGIQAARAGPSSALASALAALPAPLRPQLPIALAPSEADVLARRPLWRVGAVRGLTMLNDVDERGVHDGIAAEYLEQVSRRLGVATQVVPYDSVAAMLQGVQQGEIDLIPFLTRTPARAKRFAFSAPYVEMPYMIVARGDDTLYWGLSSLKGKRLALAPEHPLRDYVARELPEIQVVEAASGNGAMDLVAAGRADAAVEVKLFANLRINADNDGRLRVLAPVDELSAQFHFAAAPRDAELIPLVDRALADIPQPERQRMFSRWVARDLNPGIPWRRWMPQITVAAAALLVLLSGSAVWAARLRREVRARRRSDELCDDIVRTVPGIVFRYTIDPAGRLRHRYVSPSSREFLGVALGEDVTVGTSMLPFIPGDYREQVRLAELRSATEGVPFKITAPFEAPGRPPRWLHAEAVRKSDHRGNTVWTGYVVDVSTERDLQARLTGEAQARNLMLATASHELRAPTHNLSLALQAIDSGGLDNAQARAVRIAQRSAQTLAMLLNDVLDAARFEFGPLRLTPARVRLDELLDELAEAWGAAAADKGLGFSLHSALDLPSEVIVDPLRLKQVLINLLSNACKYTHAGRFDLSARRDGDMLCFEVSDTGPGIAEPEQQRLFEPFVTLETPRQAPTLSSGLGLTVSRRIAEAMGGRVTLRSEPGKGSVFAFEVPCRVAPPVAEAAKSVATGTSASDGEVVVCDDDDTTRMLTAHMLRTRGYAVLEAADGEDVLRAWRTGRVRALVTDLDMPSLSGRELIERLRGEESSLGTRTPVVVCSGSLPASGKEPLQHDAFLLKPLQMEVLARTLSSLGVHPAKAAEANPAS